MQDWLDLKLSDEDRVVVESFFGLRPEWLALGNPEKALLARFESEVEGVEPLEVDLDECSIFWGKWHGHYDIGVPEGIERAVEAVEDILAERRVRVVKFFANGEGTGSTICKPEDIHLERPRPEAVGWALSVLPGQAAESNRPVLLKVTSWRGALSQEICLEL